MALGDEAGERGGVQGGCAAWGGVPCMAMFGGNRRERWLGEHRTIRRYLVCCRGSYRGRQCQQRGKRGCSQQRRGAERGV